MGRGVVFCESGRVECGALWLAGTRLARAGLAGKPRLVVRTPWAYRLVAMDPHPFLRAIDSLWQRPDLCSHLVAVLAI